MTYFMTFFCMSHNVCCCSGCKSKTRERLELSYYRIPNEKRQRKMWINALGFVPSKNARICSKHFISGTSLKSHGNVLEHKSA